MSSERQLELQHYEFFTRLHIEIRRYGPVYTKGAPPVGHSPLVLPSFFISHSLPRIA
jgi:hypothetical protein